MKELLTSAPYLAYPRPEGMFILDTDASKYTIGAEFSQVQDRVVRPIAYASNILLPAQQKYCTTFYVLHPHSSFTVPLSGATPSYTPETEDKFSPSS